MPASLPVTLFTRMSGSVFSRHSAISSRLSCFIISITSGGMSFFSSPHAPAPRPLVYSTTDRYPMPLQKPVTPSPSSSAARRRRVLLRLQRIHLPQQLQQQLLQDHFDHAGVGTSHAHQTPNHHVLKVHAVTAQNRQQRTQQLVQLRLDRLAQNREDFRQQLAGSNRDDFGG